MEQPVSALPLLEVRGLCKHFPGVQALTDVSLRIRSGEVHALMGENGAGKSTLIKILTGVHERDKGEILLEGIAINPRSPQEALSLGISTVYQEINLIPHLSVAENICLGRQRMRWGCLDWPAIHRRAKSALSRLGIELDVRKSVSACSIAVQQLVAIARSLDLDAKLLILDEPTSSLDAREVEQLFSLLRQLKSQGLGIIFITHFLNQVYAIADRITILRNGQNAGDAVTGALPRLELIAKMLGKTSEEAQTLTSPRTIPTDERAGTKLLTVQGLGRKNVLFPVSLEFAQGDIIGLAGLLGSGRTELARLLFGIDAPDQGRMILNDERIEVSSPRTAIRYRFGFCPEDRKTEAIIPSLSVRENIILALQASRGWLGCLSAHEQRALAEEFIGRLRIVTPDAEQPIKLLSGGNQQKTILARWLASEPSFLILDEPNRGVDIGAKFEIESLMQKLAGQGMAILFISSEWEELVRNCRKIAVMRDRSKVAELRGTEISEGSIMRTIAGTADVSLSSGGE